MSNADAAVLLSRPEWPLLVALAIGLLIGLERERRKGDGASRSPAGLRTFALVGLLGGLAALIGNTGLILLAGSFVALGALAAYSHGDRTDPGLTGEVALAATYVLGTMAQSRASWLVRREPKQITKAQTVGRAFNGVAVLLFVVLVGSFSLASELLIRWLGAPGALVGAAVMGFADAHAASVSMATLFAGERLAVAAAAIGVILTLTTNMAVKIPPAFIAGSRSYGRQVTIGVGLLLTGLWLGGLLSAFTGATASGWMGPIL